MEQKIGDIKIMLYICTQYDLPRFSLEQRTRGGLRVLKKSH